MPWWPFKKRRDDKPQTTNPEQSFPAPAERPRADPSDPAVRERRRQRLERRIRELRYDVARAESSLAAENRWSERVREIDQAIEQTRGDLERALRPETPHVPFPLPAWPVTIEQVNAGEPSDVRFRVGDIPFRYSEEVDWAERGHQKAELILRRREGAIDALIPVELPQERRPALEEHLAHSLAAFAVQLRDDALMGQTTPAITLADLASPCPVCGGWRDLRDRCLECQRREWEAQGLRAEIERLLDERNSQLEEVQRWRESLPILRRQLQQAEEEILKYQ
jgi:hypothetical protein